MKRFLMRSSWPLLGLVLLAGCTQAVSQIKMASTYNVDLSKKYTLVAEGVSEASSNFFFLLYFGGEDVDYYKAMGSVLAKHDGDLLTDVEITQSSYFLILGAYVDYKVKGNVWRAVEEPVLGEADGDELFELRMVEGTPYLVSEDGHRRHRVETPSGRG